jgi:outer membrane usher protein
VRDNGSGIRCRFRIDASPQAGAFPVLGPYVCAQETK